MKLLFLLIALLALAGCTIVRDNPLDKKGENYDPVYLYKNAVYLRPYFVPASNPTVQVMLKNVPQNIATMHIAFRDEVMVKSAKLLYTQNSSVSLFSDSNVVDIAVLDKSELIGGTEAVAEVVLHNLPVSGNEILFDVKLLTHGDSLVVVDTVRVEAVVGGEVL